MLFKAGDCLFSLWKNNQKDIDEVDNYPEVLRPPPIPHKYGNMYVFSPYCSYDDLFVTI